MSHTICRISDPANLPLLLTSFPIYLEEKLIVDSRGKCCPWVQQGRKKYKQINNIHLPAVFKNGVKHQFWWTTFLFFLKQFRARVKSLMGWGIAAVGMPGAASPPLQAAALFWATLPTPQQLPSLPATHCWVWILQSCCFSFLALILWSNPSLGLGVVGPSWQWGENSPALHVTFSQIPTHFLARVFILPLLLFHNTNPYKFSLALPIFLAGGAEV